MFFFFFKVSARLSLSLSLSLSGMLLGQTAEVYLIVMIKKIYVWPSVCGVYLKSEASYWVKINVVCSDDIRTRDLSAVSLFTTA